MESKYRILIKPLKSNKITVANVAEMFERAIEETAEPATRQHLADPHKYEKLRYWCSLTTMNLYCAFLDTLPFCGMVDMSEGVTYKGYIVHVADMDDDVVMFGTK